MAAPRPLVASAASAADDDDDGAVLSPCVSVSVSASVRVDCYFFT